MCGIGGCWFTTGARVDADEYSARMFRTMGHRGPDGVGLYAQDDLLLVHSRLSIIDLSGGAQPIFSEDGSKLIIMNGEIYNYQSLREMLVARGHQFTTNSDTEVVLHGYEEWGESVSAHLNGMFAFAVWDKSAETLYLSRDRMGEKPLYYLYDGSVLIFASEIKTILSILPSKPQIDRDALTAFLSYKYIPELWSVYRGIKKLEKAMKSPHA